MIRRLVQEFLFRVIVARDDLTGRTLDLDGRDVEGADVVGDGFYMLTADLGSQESPIPTLRVHPGFSLHLNGWRLYATRILTESGSEIRAGAKGDQ